MGEENCKNTIHKINYKNVIYEVINKKSFRCGNLKRVMGISIFCMNFINGLESFHDFKLKKENTLEKHDKINILEKHDEINVVSKIFIFSFAKSIIYSSFMRTSMSIMIYNIYKNKNYERHFMPGYKYCPQLCVGK